MMANDFVQNEFVKGPTPGATRQIAPLARGGSEGGSCLLKCNGTQRDIVIQDVYYLFSESLKDCINLGFIH